MSTNGWGCPDCTNPDGWHGDNPSGLYSRWRRCPDCIMRMKRLHYAKVDRLDPHRAMRCPCGTGLILPSERRTGRCWRHLGIGIRP